MALLETEGLSKSFAGVPVLSGVDFAAEAGEVHALVGANGAGKSTFLNIVSGSLAPSAGVIRLAGAAVRFATPQQAHRAGVSIVHQEFSLAPLLDVATNVFLGREPRTRLGLVDRARMRHDAAALLDTHGFRLDPDAPVAGLSVAEQQLVEIARALSFEAQVLILDEPTAALSPPEQQRLFAVIERLKAVGVAILYVSHRLDEVFRIADRVTVLRNGIRVATRRVADLDHAGLVSLMLGEAAAAAAPPPRATPGSVRLAATYRAGEATSSIVVRAGEIVGLAGFVGAGRTHLARALAGRARSNEIEMTIDGKAVDRRSAGAALRHGVVYVTEDRKRDGLFVPLGVLANTTAGALDRVSRFGLLQAGREQKLGGDMLARLRLAAPSLAAPVNHLSGGNQQKAVFARALLAEPRVLICDEPTRGVDVGAKAQIHDLLVELAGRGLAVLVVSSEFAELLAVADRILVMRDRAVVAAFARGTVDEPTLFRAASGDPAVLAAARPGLPP
ncbi:sugar ABC transporter ATP-binding protein [Rhodoplanes sp. TEM]|uniref:sugar ABC transporter ATP-binding protein n=1 Tax=Rhodoplanes TaxID=29407 RepID=UPI002350889A|nr:MULTISPECIES: sugar ABC transporter ATP-binding protein [Rhodoplanes]MDC7987699.1 sugar ABC transporter ATP-binding protein [Rhodoplanes sp. TEM]MDQ0358092.1 ABC-type sugar transport system ATPase subunit [Rhodoplanes tepidamans]